MHYMLIVNLYIMWYDVYINVDMIIIMINADLLNLLMNYST